MGKNLQTRKFTGLDHRERILNKSSVAVGTARAEEPTQDEEWQRMWRRPIHIGTFE